MLICISIDTSYTDISRFHPREVINDNAHAGLHDLRSKI